jgi:hypothetical protein
MIVKGRVGVVGMGVSLDGNIKWPDYKALAAGGWVDYGKQSNG